MIDQEIKIVLQVEEKTKTSFEQANKDLQDTKQALCNIFTGNGKQEDLTEISTIVNKVTNDIDIRHSGKLELYHVAV